MEAHGAEENNGIDKELLQFAQDYTAAWSSHDGQKVASHYATDGRLTVNNGEPMTGRAELTAFAESFATAFPDFILELDSLQHTDKGIEYHWTFKGTNTGPEGTGNRVRFSGFELWTLNEDGKIQNSIGTFDEDEYNRQVENGIEE